MKTKLLFVMIATLPIVGFAQWPSDCNPPPVLLSNYDRDVKDLALKYLYEIKSADTALIDIPQWCQDTVWHGLAAIFSRRDQVEVDSIFNKHCVHGSLPNIIIYNQILVKVDTTFGWTVNWMNLQSTTGIPDLDSLLNHYGFTVTRFYHWFSHTTHYAVLETSQNLNVNPLCYNLTMFPGIISSRPNGAIGDGNYIEFSQNGQIKLFTFSLGWGDCPSGCTSRHNWKFQVNPDCSVDLLGIENFIIDNYYPTPVNCNLTEGIAEQQGKELEISLFPNPAESYITVESNDFAANEFRVLDSFGRTILVGIIKEKISLNVSSYSSGIYLFQLIKGKKMIGKKFLIHK